MDRARQLMIEELLKTAERYRRAARGSLPWSVAENLERWADDCEREAAALLADQPLKAA